MGEICQRIIINIMYLQMGVRVITQGEMESSLHVNLKCGHECLQYSDLLRERRKVRKRAQHICEHLGHGM